MGKGSNVQKAERARADAAKKKAKEGAGGGGGDGIAKRTATRGYKCKQCMVSWLPSDKINWLRLAVTPNKPNVAQSRPASSGR